MLSYNKLGMVHSTSLYLSSYNFQIINFCLSLKIIFVLTNNANPDEVVHCEAFLLGLHCLPKYLFTSILYTKDMVKKHACISKPLGFSDKVPW